MEERGWLLATRAADIWPHHDTDENLILADELRELRVRSGGRSPDSLMMRDSVRDLLYAIRDATRELGDSIEPSNTGPYAITTPIPAASSLRPFRWPTTSEFSFQLTLMR